MTTLFDTTVFDACPDRADTDQRYTPTDILQKVERILVSIGLDPTANPQKTVPAWNHITEAQDCFKTDWAQFLDVPTAFMNPPYSGTASFLERWCEYVESGAIRTGITLTLAGVLCNKSTQALIKKHAVATCHPYGRLSFVGSGSSFNRDCVFILWGEKADIAAFEREMNGLVSLVVRA